MIVEDVEDDAVLVLRELRRGDLVISHERVDSKKAFLKALTEKEWDLILCDYSMPHFRGVQALQLVQERGLNIPFIFVSGTIGEDVAVQAMKNGAHDYVMKGNLKRLVPAVVRELKDAEERRARKVAENELRRSEERFRILIEKNSDIIATVNENGKILYQSPSMQHVLGYSPEDLAGRNTLDFVHPDDFTRISTLFAELTAIPGGLRSAAMRARHKDTSWRWLEVTAQNFLQNPSVQAVILNYHDVTHEREAREALQQSEERLTMAISASGQGLWDWDLQTDNAYLSPRYYELTGYKEGEVAPNLKFLHTIVHPDDLAEVKRTMGEHIQGKSEYSIIEYRMRQKSGEYRWVHGVGKVVNRDETGAPLRMVGTISDITERKKLEEEVRISERLYRDLVENSNEVTYLLDRRLRLTYISPIIEKRTGYAPSELLGRLFAGMIVSDDLQMVKNRFRVMLGGRIMEPAEFRLRTKGGETLWVRASMVPVMRKNKLESIRGVAIDITERKRAEDAVTESERRLSTLMSNLPGMVYRCTNDPDWTTTFISDGCLDLTGYTVKDLLHNATLSYNRIVHPDDRERVWDTVQESVRNQKPFQLEYRIVTAENRVKWVWEQGRGIFNAGGDLLFLEGFITDITERKQTEEALHLKSEELERYFTNSLDLLCIADTDGTFRRLNPQWEKTLGYSLSELEGTRFLDFIHPDDLDATVERISMLSRQETIVSFTNRYRHKDGSYRWIEWRSIPQGNLIYAAARDITKRKEGELALRESEERYRLILKHSMDAILLTSPEGPILSANPAACAMFGRTEEEICRLGRKGLVDPQDPRLNDIIEQRERTGFAKGELSLLRGDGTRFPAELSSSIFVDSTGVRRTSMIIRDISDRVQAEEQLRQSEQQYRDVVENATDVIYLTDIDGRFTYANPAGLRISGYSLDELKASTYLDLVEPSYRKQVSIMYMRQFLNRTPSTAIDFPYKTKSGELRWFSQVASLVLADGTPTGFRIIARDITDRKKAEDRLHDSEERYRQFFENDLTGDYISTPDGKLLECNPAFLKIFGFASREEALQTNTEVLHSHPGARKEFLDRLRKEKLLIYEEGTGRRIDGTLIHVVENVTGTFNDEGELVEIRGYLFDDTKRKIIEQQFYHAQKMESIGTLAGGIAHDFNNILGIILGHASLMNRLMEDPSKLSQSVDAIQKATNRGAALVRQLLTFARKTEPQFQSLRINNIIQEITGLIAETFPKTITVSHGLQTDLPSISGDPTQIHQVLLNLCVNARDAMPEGGRLLLSTSVVDGGKINHLSPEAVSQEYVAIEVSDTGTGMDDATRERIFEPFFTTKGVGKGTGLGLSLVHSIVTNHRGFIDVRGSKGVGTTFLVYFPTERQLPALPVQTDKPKSEIRGGNETILVIEDEEMLRELLRAVLSAKGYTVITAEDGVEGIEMVERRGETIAAIVSDFGLPRLQGDAVLKEARALNPEIKFILASGYLEPSVRREIEKHGCRHFLQKPYVPEAVLALVREAIDEKGTQ